MKKKGSLILKSKNNKTKDFERAVFGNKRLKPASLTAQKAWHGFTAKKKNELRKKNTDTDKDKVPDKWDCKPRNPKKQESFLPADTTFLSRHSDIKVGKKINEGTEGAVYQVEGNRNLVVKVAKGYRDDSGIKYTTPSAKESAENHRMYYVNMTRDNILNEAKAYQSQDFNSKPLFIPTKVVNLGVNDLDNGEYIGLVRPRVTPVMDFHNKVSARHLNRVTNKQLEYIRQKLIELSEQGYVFVDGLQIGLDIRNRPLIYDAGKLEKFGWNDPHTFRINNKKWISFLQDIGRIPVYGDYQEELKKYGEIEQRHASNW